MRKILNISIVITSALVLMFSLLWHKNVSIPHTEIYEAPQIQEITATPTANESVPHVTIAEESTNIQITHAPLEKLPEIVTPVVVETAPRPLPQATQAPPPQTDSGTPRTAGLLNERDIWILSNVEREKNSLPTLTYSARLAAIAEAKALDMLEKQYFEHVSPSGVDIKQLSEKFGYPYLSIGENLALGDFTSSAHVVDGWMNSPGHKANILGRSFTEIGVATIIGTYEGSQVWFAVQEFGRPLSDCVQPNTLMGQKITIFNEQLKALELSLTNLEKEMTDSKENPTLYNTQAKDYNTIVSLYNSIAETTKSDIAMFNEEVREYNACIGKI